MKMIKLIGRRDLKLAPLGNMTDGGECVVGYKHNEEDKRKMERKVGIKELLNKN